MIETGLIAERASARWESLEATAAIRLRFLPPLSIASSQKRTASAVNGFGPGDGPARSPAGPVAISIASTAP